MFDGTVGALLLDVGNELDSQNRLCFDNDVPVLNDWSHRSHFTCMRQSACILL